MTRGAGLGARLILLSLWFAVALLLALHHVMWRDEVRALSFAIQGRTTIDMLRMLHGEGHPALWYLLLRGGFVLTHSMLVLPVAAFAIGAGAATLLALRAPFGWPLLALALFGRFLLYEYTVMARNYGLSALILFALAALYSRWRARGVGIGLLLALLCNTNVHSVVLAAAFGLFWAIDLWCDPAIGRWHAVRLLVPNALIAALGVAACIAEVYPAHNDIAQAAATPTGLAVHLALLPLFLGTLYLSLGNDGPVSVGAPLLSLLLLGSPLVLARSPGALAAAVTALLGMFCVFLLVYPGEYRHEALYLVFLLTMLWLSRDGFGGGWPIAPWGERIGFPCLVVLLLIGVWQTANIGRNVARDRPESRARDLGNLLQQTHLTKAVVMSDPDVVLETLPYYVPGPLYLARERRFGRIFSLTRAAMRPMGFGELLSTARMLHSRTSRPVVILIHSQIDGPVAPSVQSRKWYGPFIMVPRDVAAFRAATRRIARFGPATSDESYDVYVLSGA